MGGTSVLLCPDPSEATSLACCPISSLARAQLDCSCLRRSDAFVEGTGCTQSRRTFSKFFI